MLPFRLLLFLLICLPLTKAYSQGVKVKGSAHWIIQGGAYIVIANGGGFALEEEAVYQDAENSVMTVTGNLVNQTENISAIQGQVTSKGDSIKGDFDINQLIIASADSVILSRQLMINQNLTLHDGLLVVPTESQLLLNENVVQIASDSSYINGALAVKLESEGAKSLQFNIGTAAMYAPVLLNFNKSDASKDTITLQVLDQLPENELPEFFESISDKAAWLLQINEANSSFSGGEIIIPLIDKEIDETKIAVVKSENGTWKNLNGTVETIDNRRVVRSTLPFEEAGVFAVGIKRSNSNLEWEVKPAEGLVSSSTSQETQLIFTNANQLNSESVLLKYRSLREDTYNSIGTNQNGNTYMASLSAGLFDDDFGVSYFFEFKDSTGVTYKSDEQYIYYKYPSNHFQQPLHAGTEPSDYQIVTIPLNLDNKTVAAVMGDDFGSYDSASWRLFHYQNGDYEEYDNPQSIIERGKGYWLISKEEKSLTFGDGDMALVNNEPFTISLDTGWNQIGNPYNFNILWEDVLNHNNLTTNDLEIIGYRDGSIIDLSKDTLYSFEGAFVKVDDPLSLQIPFRSGSITGGRLQSSSVKDTNSWFLPFSLSGEKTGYDIAGFGMHPDASEALDSYDLEIFPRFIHYLDIDFGKGLTRNIVPLQDAYVWNFTVSSNHADGESVTLLWDNLSFINSSYQLILLDQVNLRPIDMRQIKQYTFRLVDGKRSFAVFYGTDEEIKEQMRPSQIAVGQVFPNPTANGLYFPVSIPDDRTATIMIQVVDLTGRQIQQIQQEVSSGYQMLHWDGNDQQGKPAGTGMYLYQLTVTGTEKVFLGKFLVQP